MLNRIYVTPSFLTELRDIAGDSPLGFYLADPPRHHEQHRYGVPAALLAPFLPVLSRRIDAWELAKVTATGRGADGRSALTRRITEARDVIAAAGGEFVPPVLAVVMYRLTPRMFDAIRVRTLAPAVRVAVENANHHAESRKWEVVIPVQAQAGFRAMLADLRAEVDARHGAARATEKSRLGGLRRELSGMGVEDLSVARGKIVPAPVSAHALRGRRREAAPAPAPKPKVAPAPKAAPAPPAPPSRAELIAALGTAPDADIAARFGSTTSAVRQARTAREIPAFTAVRERDIEATLTAHPDWSMRAVARALGVAVTTVIRTAERLQGGKGRSQASLKEQRKGKV